MKKKKLQKKLKKTEKKLSKVRLKLSSLEADMKQNKDTTADQTPEALVLAASTGGL